MLSNIKSDVTKNITDLNSKHMNLSPYYFFLLIVIFLILLLSVLKYGLQKIYYKFNKNLINLMDFEKIYLTSPTIVSIVDNPNYNKYALRDFFVKTAYNCCCSSSFKDSYVNIGALEVCIKQGVRCLDFEIHSLNNEPVVAITSLDSYSNTKSYNSLPIDTVLTKIAQQAFSAGICSNFNDPIILHFRIMNNNKIMYNNFADIISKLSSFNSLLLGNAYSHEGTRQDNTQATNLGALKILDFKQKIIICVYGANPFYRSTKLDEYINIVSGQQYMHLLRYNDIKFNPNKDLMQWNKLHMTIVLPNPQTYLENSNFNICRESGSQFIGMSFPNNDIYLQQYNQFFNNNRSAFVLKDASLRDPTAVPASAPEQSSQPRTSLSTEAQATRTNCGWWTRSWWPFTVDALAYDNECKVLYGPNWAIDGDPIEGECVWGRGQANCREVIPIQQPPSSAKSE